MFLGFVEELDFNIDLFFDNVGVCCLWLRLNGVLVVSE